VSRSRSGADSMRIDFTATVREVPEVLIAGLLARH
jgi:hypothetical protein